MLNMGTNNKTCKLTASETNNENNEQQAENVCNQPAGSHLLAQKLLFKDGSTLPGVDGKPFTTS